MTNQNINDPKTQLCKLINMKIDLIRLMKHQEKDHSHHHHHHHHHHQKKKILKIVHTRN